MKKSMKQSYLETVSKVFPNGASRESFPGHWQLAVPFQDQGNQVGPRAEGHTLSIKGHIVNILSFVGPVALCCGCPTLLCRLKAAMNSA